MEVPRHFRLRLAGHTYTQHRVADMLAMALLLGATVLYYRSLALSDSILVGFDIFTYFYPNEQFATDSLRKGVLPLWNPYLFSGVPFIANMQTAVFYPFNLVFLLSSIPRAYAFSLVLHVFLAAAFTYLFCRACLRLGPIPSVAAASTFAFSGFMGSMVGHLNQLQTAVWLPLLLLLVHLTWRQRSIVYGCMGGIVLALQILAGHAQEFYMSLCMLVVFLAYEVFCDSASTRAIRGDTELATEPDLDKSGLTVVGRGLVPRRPAADEPSPYRQPYPNANGSSRQSEPAPLGAERAVRPYLSGVWVSLSAYCARAWARVTFESAVPFLAMAALGLGLAAVQLVPTAELSALSIRSGGMSYKEAVSFSFPPWMFLKALFPVYADPQPFSEYTGYIGVFGLVLCIFAISTSLRRPFALFFVIVAGLSIFLALGQFNPLYPAAFKLVPGLSLFRVPARWLFLYTFSASVLVGFGIASIEAKLDSEQKKRAVAKLATAALVFLMSTGAAFLVARSTFPAEIPSYQTMAVWALSFLVGMALTLTGCFLGHPAMRMPLLAVILIELFASGGYLDLNRANVPEAYTSMRPAIAHLLADRSVYRILALSENTYEPGDTAEIKSMLRGVLSSEQIYDFLVATKLKETLMPNIPLRYGIATFDGYDGGVLPLKRYTNFKQLLAGKTTPDGRLREEMEAFPDSRLAGWLNIKYILMDRVRDAWIDGVYYDLALSRSLSASDDSFVVSSLPSFETTSIGVVSHLVGSTDLSDGTPVATVKVTDIGGESYELTFRAGDHTSEGRWAESNEYGAARHREARKAKGWKDAPTAWDYLGVLPLPEPVIPREISIRYLQPRGQLVVNGISEIDDRTRTSTPVTLSDSYRLTHIGDVKIYENKETLPRAFVVHEAAVAADDTAALRMLGDELFQHGRRVVLLEGELQEMNEWGLAAGHDQITAGPTTSEPSSSQEPAVIDVYEPGRVVVKATLHSPGFLVITDSHYPGWRAFVDGKENPILRADYMFRAVRLDAGEHVVELRYEPLSLTIGAAISAAALLALLALLARYARAGRWRATR